MKVIVRQSFLGFIFSFILCFGGIFAFIIHTDLVKWLSSCSCLFLCRLHENWPLVEFRYLGIQVFRN